jgi:hypothetical protein
VTAHTAGVLAVVLACAAPAAGQTPAHPISGHASVMFDVLPDVGELPGRQAVRELRARVYAERTDDLGAHVRLVASGYADGLVAHRLTAGSSSGVHDAVARPLDLHLDAAWRAFDLRVGISRVVWGRLDELQPTDVVNPIDLTRFLLEGRSEARLPVGLVRARAFMPKQTTLEVVIVPVFRAGRFDQLDEDTSPFDLRPGAIARVRHAPDRSWRNAQGGARVTSTARRLDWAVMAYRGIRAFPTSRVRLVGPPAPFVAPVPEIVETFPRVTMVGGDFETVRGPWGLRGELAAFVDDELQSSRLARGVAGRSVEGGVGVDRRAGSYRVAGNVLWSWRGVDRADPATPLLAGDPEVERGDLTLVGSADRSFARETRTVRAFAAYDPVDRTFFGRIIGAVNVRTNVWLEGSGGLFAGSATDTLGRLTRRDFLYTRLKVFF